MKLSERLKQLKEEAESMEGLSMDAIEDGFNRVIEDAEFFEKHTHVINIINHLEDEFKKDALMGVVSTETHGEFFEVKYKGKAQLQLKVTIDEDEFLEEVY